MFSVVMPMDAQLFAGRQIHVVCIAGSGIALYNGIAAYFKLPVVAGVDVYSAADICGILFDRTAGEIADRAGAVNIDAAAVARCGISADNAAGHIQYGRFAVKVDCTAVFGTVVDKGAAFNIDAVSLVGILVNHAGNRAAEAA